MIDNVQNTATLFVSGTFHKKTNKNLGDKNLPTQTNLTELWTFSAPFDLQKLSQNCGTKPNLQHSSKKKLLARSIVSMRQWTDNQCVALLFQYQSRTTPAIPTRNMKNIRESWMEAFHEDYYKKFE